MEIKLLKGGSEKVRLSNKQFDPNRLSKSKFQHSIGIELLQKYPHDIIFAEIIIPSERFVLDFFIPSLRLVVECHGKQHTQHIKHFHKTKIDFHKQKDKDQRKREWCSLNGFKLIEIYDE